MSIKKLILAVLVCGLSAGCGSDSGNDASETTSGTSSPSEETASWTSVSYKWLSAWEPCNDNQLTISRNKQISSDRCGEIKTATISDADFASLQTKINPALQSFSAKISCTNEAIMDWAVYTYMTVGDDTKNVYSFDDQKKCARGPSAIVEQLQDAMDVLHDKYVPTENFIAE